VVTTSAKGMQDVNLSRSHLKIRLHGLGIVHALENDEHRVIFDCPQ
jgi:hypothetical protein